MTTNNSLISTLPLTLAVISMIVMCVTCGKSTIQHNQRSMKTPPLSTKTYSATTADYELCVSKCKKVDNCVSVNARYDCSKAEMTCEFLKTSMDDVAGSPQAASGWVFLQRKTEEKYAYPMEKPWALVFRATPGNGKNVLDVWNEDGRHDDPKKKKACTIPKKSTKCTTHFRGSTLDNWDNIDQVRITVHKAGELVGDLIFDGKGSTRSNWLDKSRLVSSSWTDLTRTTSTNFFSILGLDFVYRRFYLSANHGGCPNDAGWLVVTDVTSTGASVRGQCTWDNEFPAPAVLYSPKTTKVVWQSDQVGVADVMMVHVKFGTPEKYAYPLGHPWALAFRATGGNGKNVLNAWNQDGRHDDPDKNKACTVPKKSADCTTHFRGSILDNWHNIDQVRITVHKDNKIVGDLIFNAKGTTRSSWLDKSRLVKSSWTDLNTSTRTNFFSILGLDFVYRRFYLSANHGGCPNDAGWLVVTDVTSTGASVRGQCTWDNEFPAPAVLYSPKTTKVVWQSDQVGVADVMMVSVKFSS